MTALATLFSSGTGVFADHAKYQRGNLPTCKGFRMCAMMDLSPSLRSPGALMRWRIHRIVARILKHGPERRAEAFERLESMRKINSYIRHLDAWERLLRGPPQDLQQVLTGWTEEAAGLRETSPCGFLAPMSLRNKILSPGRTPDETLPSKGSLWLILRGT
jgi:hypothetical protein